MFDEFTDRLKFTLNTLYPVKRKFYSYFTTPRDRIVLNILLGLFCEYLNTVPGDRDYQDLICFGSSSSFVLDILPSLSVNELSAITRPFWSLLLRYDHEVLYRELAKLMNLKKQRAKIEYSMLSQGVYSNVDSGDSDDDNDDGDDEAEDRQIREVSWNTLCSSWIANKTSTLIDTVNKMTYRGRNIENLPWDFISCLNLPLHFIEKYKTQLNWKMISICNDNICTSLDLIKRFCTDLDFPLMIQYRVLPRDVISALLEERDKICHIMRWQPLSMDMVSKLNVRYIQSLVYNPNTPRSTFALLVDNTLDSLYPERKEIQRSATTTTTTLEAPSIGLLTHRCSSTNEDDSFHRNNMFYIEEFEEANLNLIRTWIADNVFCSASGIVRTLLIEAINDALERSEYEEAVYFLLNDVNDQFWDSILLTCERLHNNPPTDFGTTGDIVRIVVTSKVESFLVKCIECDSVIPWGIVSRCFGFVDSVSFELFEKYLHWNVLITSGTIKTFMIDLYPEKWSGLSPISAIYNVISPDALVKYPDLWKWEEVFEHQDLNNTFIENLQSDMPTMRKVLPRVQCGKMLTDQYWNRHQIYRMFADFLFSMLFFKQCNSPNSCPIGR